MVEFLLVDGGDIGTAPLVLGVAIAAVGVVGFAMQPRLAADICGNILVAVDAQFVLGLFVEALMALFALVFVLDVPRNDVAGHQYLFDRLRRCPASKDDGGDQRQTRKQPINTCGPQQHGRLH